MKRGFALVLLASLTAAGCVSAPARRAEAFDVSPPDAWTAASSPPGAIENGWWSTFGDTGLDDAIATALANNRDLRVAAAAVDQVAALAKIQRADLRPSIGVGVNASRGRNVFVGFPIETGEVPAVTTTTYGASVDISWEVDLWGRLRAASRAALADLQAAGADLEASRLSLAGLTAKAWFAVAEAVQQVELTENTVTSWEESYRQVVARYEKGIRPALDVRLALTNLESARSALEVQRLSLDAAIRQLEILLGRYPGRSIPIPRELPDTPAPIPTGLPADLVSRRPDLMAAERRLAAADQRVLEARRSLYPRLSLTGSAGTVSAALEDLVDGDFRVWSLAAGLLQPIFQGGRLRAGVEFAEAGSVGEMEAFASEALKAYGEVETALAAEGFLKNLERHRREAADQAEAARRLAEDRYLTGLEPYITVLESQRRSVVAESDWLAARRLRLANRVDLFLALGGGFRVPGVEVPVSASERPAPSDSKEKAS